jgi:hypothetical protein
LDLLQQYMALRPVRERSVMAVLPRPELRARLLDPRLELHLPDHSDHKVILSVTDVTVTTDTRKFLELLLTGSPFSAAGQLL